MSKTSLSWTDEVARREESIVALRRDLHRHPELSFEERRTAGIIAEQLEAAGLEVRTGVARTGVVGVLRGDRPGRTVAWRADIDALPLTEVLDAPFASSTPGVMHACGHDGHAAIGIALAEILAARRGEMPGTAVFLFQPAEEIIAGARPMIEAGVLDDPRVDEVYGLHLTTRARAGQVAVRPGPVNASCDSFSVEVRGTGGHGAMPHLSIDPITAAANILLGMQAIVAREVPAQDTAVMTVGQITAGTKGNIIPERALMRGTIRAYDQAIRSHLVHRLRGCAADIARAYRAEAETLLDSSCPAVVNHPGPTALVRERTVAALGAHAVVEGRPTMASDDMSLFLQERPGCFFFVGIAPEAGPATPHHAPEFEMNEAGLSVGVRAGLAVLLGALAAP
jgi:amidohydrolase